MSARTAYAAAELAGKPGMPSTKRAVNRRAEAEAWPFREEAARGGTRRLYLVEHLPAATRAALAWNQSQVVVQSPEPAGQAGRVEGARLALQSGLDQRAALAHRQASLRQANALDAKAQLRMDARLAVVKACETYAVQSGLTLNQARIAFALAYNDGRIALDPAVHQALSKVSEPSLERWSREIRTRGVTALAGAYGNRAGSSKVDSQPAVREFVIAMLVQYPHARATHVMRGLQARFKDASLPSNRSLERWIDQWRADNAGTLLALSNPDAWKNKHMVAFGSQSEGITRMNQRWELDSTPADVMLLDGRHSLIGVIDVHPRRPMLLVSKTSKSTAIAALVRRALLAWGVPEIAKTDNGSDYTSNHITRVFTALDVDHQLCPPFQPWHKPHIERFFGTFTRDLVELLAGFIGHSVAERSAIESRKSFADRLMTRGEVVEIRMTSADLQSFCDRWIDRIYLHQPHEGLGQRTPFEVAASSTDEVRSIGDERALDILLAEAPENNGRRTVQKKGIKLDDAWFIAPELEAWVGRQVQVRYDAIEHDLGRVYVFGGDELQFICLAECPERTGMDRREVAARARLLQKQRVQEERRLLKANAKRVGVDQVVDEILRDRAAAAGKLAQLPRPGTAHASAGLAAAADAAAELQRPDRSHASTGAEMALAIDLQAARRRIEAEEITAGADNELARRRGPVPAPQFESVAQRVMWLIEQGRFRALTPEEQDTAAHFKAAQPASYARMNDLVEERFGQMHNADPARAAGSE